jgi:hypothetical protein
VGLEGFLAPDPKAPHKLHARDVLGYEKFQSVALGDPDSALSLWEQDSVRFTFPVSALSLWEQDSVRFTFPDGTVCDYSRMPTLDRAEDTVREMMGLIPPEMLTRKTGRVSLDYFRTRPSFALAPHQDQFGEWVLIYVLAREGDGGVSTLSPVSAPNGFAVREPLAPGDVLLFKDDLFLHGLTQMNGTRDALILIALND